MNACGVSMTEKTGVWDLLHKNTPQVDWARVENLVGTGICDVNGCLNGVCVWIENKLVRSGFKIKFQPTQPAWILRRIAHGGRVFILVRKDNTLYLYHGKQVQALVDVGLRLQPILKLSKPFNWPLLLDTLFGPVTGQKQ